MPKNELVSLALIYNGPAHAYAINSTIKALGLEMWSHVSQASIYTTLNRLQKEGCVALSREKSGNMPERKVFSITDVGKQRFSQELESAIGAPGTESNLFYLAVLFAYGVPASELLQLLDKRIERLESGMVHSRAGLEQIRDNGVYHMEILMRACVREIENQIRVAGEFRELLVKHPEFYSTEKSRFGSGGHGESSEHA